MRIGVDIGGTNLVAGLVDGNYNLVCKESTPALATRPDTEIVADIIMLCKKLMEKNNLSKNDIESIGVGIPGCHNPDTGVVLYCANINLHNTPMADMIRKEIDVPVFLGNDADCAALGEAYAGATKDVSDSMMITIGTGIGGGIIINKRIYNGFNHIGGELGHMVIVQDGDVCGCGRKGCWEAYGSATALIRRTKAAVEANPDSRLAKLVDGDVSRVDGKTAFDAMREGCPVGTAVVDEFVKYFSTGLINIINIFQPEKVVIGGGISKEGKPLVDAIMKHVNAERYGKDNELPKTTIHTAVLGNDAGIIGAAVLGI